MSSDVCTPRSSALVYLEKHNISESISKAVNQACAARPDDPAVFVGKLLMGATGGTVELEAAKQSLEEQLAALKVLPARQGAHI